MMMILKRNNKKTRDTKNRKRDQKNGKFTKMFTSIMRKQKKKS